VGILTKEKRRNETAGMRLLNNDLDYGHGHLKTKEPEGN
jgi:hypothetical protein